MIRSESSTDRDASGDESSADSVPASSTKKAAKKVAKKAKKKTTKKTAKKTAKKAGKKTEEKTSKKTAKKTSKKASKKSAKKAAPVPASAHGKPLVIVESPAKAKTINKYLGSKYVVRASVGHIRDLPKSKLGIDVENDFAPQYMTIKGKKDVIDELRRYAKVASAVWLATDPDREGEAIAWHVKEALELPDKMTHRVTFNEITKAAILRAFEHPEAIASTTVDAYQARRVLDRLVGYSISPLLWRKVMWGLSAGRVQSVAQRLICEREQEISAFVPVEYWTVAAYLRAEDAASSNGLEQLKAAVRAYAGVAAGDSRDEASENPDSEAEDERVPDENGEAEPKPVLPAGVFRATLRQWKGETVEIANEEMARQIEAALNAARWKVSKVERKRRLDNPRKPFITSTLQQVASTRLGFTARRTMRTAQGLYEGVDLGEEGATGLITYMRTDSVHLSDFAMDEAREVIRGTFGDAYLPADKVIYKTSSKAQAAHEAIRPTSALRTPDSIRQFIDEDQYKLYKLIWDRFIACQMNPAEFEVTSVEVEAGDGLLRASGRRLVFEGHLRVTGYSPSAEAQDMPELHDDQPLDNLLVSPDQHFTQPPSRFSEASLVKTLEKLGIGRPSTYAAIISTIVDRGYVKKEGRAFHATELGMVVNDLLVANFSRIVDSEFTARMEAQLDQIEEGGLNWVEVMRNFYELFKTELSEAEVNIETMKGIPAKDASGSEVPCPLCTVPMVTRWSTNGKFFGCANYPECRGTLPVGEDGNPVMLRKEDIECPKCSNQMVVRMSARGAFLGCSEYPKCRGTRALEIGKTDEQKLGERQFAGLKCNKCDGEMGVRIARGRPFLGCSNYPDCRNAMSFKKAETAIEDNEMVIDQELRAQKLAELDAEAERQAELSKAKAG